MPNSTRTLLIHNAAAGQHRAEAVIDALREGFGTRMPALAETEQAGDAERFAREAARSGLCEAIYIAGGDGTINEVVTGLLSAGVDSTPAVGILPSGTCNVLATELGIPCYDLKAAVEVLRVSKLRAIDVGRINDRCFLLMAGFGLDAATVGNVAPFMKTLVGANAYIVSLIRELAKAEPSRVRLTIDDETFVSDAYMVLIANVSTYGFANVKVAPFAALDDGWLDVCVFERAEAAAVGLLGQIMLLLARRHLGDPRFRYYRGRSIRVESVPEIPGQIDGDLGMSTPVTATVLPKAIRVIVP